jgi:hypothetical protein
MRHGMVNQQKVIDAALLVRAFDQAGGNDWWEAHAKLYRALDELAVVSPEGEAVSDPFALVLRMRELALAFPRKSDRDELNNIADQFHALLAKIDDQEKGTGNEDRP